MWTRLVFVGILILFTPELEAQEQPFDWSMARELNSAVRYERTAVQNPRKLVIHAACIDTQAPGLRLVTTARRDDWVDGLTETDRQTTRDFVRALRAKGSKAVFAVNADAFSPWPVPWNESTPTNLQGLAVSDEVLVSSGTGTPSLIQDATGRMRIVETHARDETTGIRLAVSGFAMCLKDGVPVPSADILHPRTGLGLTSDARYVIAMAIDGRQTASLGATTQELGQWLQKFGAEHGINMDGGGSTSMVWWDESAIDGEHCRLLNQPVGNGQNTSAGMESDYRPTERFNGNNLAVIIE